MLEQKKFLFVFIIAFFNNIYLKAQETYLQFNREYYNTLEHELASSDFHTAIKPYINSEIKKHLLSDTVPSFFLFKKQFAFYNWTVTPYPIATLRGGYDLNYNESSLETSIGAGITASFKNKLALNAHVETANSSLSSNLDSFTFSKRVIPGYGYAYLTKKGYHYKDFTGYLSYSPTSWFNAQLGKGRNFLGDGYRSLFLSDNSSSYSFLKLSTSIWKIKYLVLFTNLKEIRNSNGKKNDFADKYATFHYLSWNISKWLNVGLFESIVFQSRDTSSSLGYDVNYLNPIIFFRPVEYSIGSPDNALLGGSVRVKIKSVQLYGQLLLDEFLLKEVKSGQGWWANKHGLQGGVKWFNIAGVKNLNLRAEFNYVRPFTYSHSNSLINYAHYNQPLAHPAGANFQEVVSFLSYNFKRFYIEGRISYLRAGTDSLNKNYGSDLYKSNTTREREYGNFMLQGLRYSLGFIDLKTIYFLDREGMLQLEVGVSKRKYSGSFRQDNTMLFAGIRSAISNFYRDY